MAAHARLFTGTHTEERKTTSLLLVGFLGRSTSTFLKMMNDTPYFSTAVDTDVGKPQSSVFMKKPLQPLPPPDFASLILP
eukprot:scaffold342_cov128-Amphora_coffeaeformis.AAC.5